MHPVLLKSILSLVLGIPIGILVIKLIFKKSIFANISIFWLADLLFVIMNTRVGDHFPDKYPYAIVFSLNVVVSIILVYFSHKFATKPLLLALSNLKLVAKGKLNTTLSKERQQRKDEIGELARINQQLINTFRNVIEEINTSSNSINAMGNTLNQSAGVFSEGASNQASSLEQITSSMEEMMANIDSNTQNAIETEKLASEAQNSVKEGNETALTALNSMKDIADKIQIITDIALQTNILALNAAVEAARAGEHGKGFAVVAAEVRKLAERSKDAAAEISEVSSKGANISKKASELLNKTLPLIQNTTTQIQEIAAASKEQSQGAAQINSAVQEINNNTQTYTQMTQKMSENSGQLVEQANKLNEQVGYFEL